MRNFFVGLAGKPFPGLGNSYETSSKSAFYKQCYGSASFWEADPDPDQSEKPDRIQSFILVKSRILIRITVVTAQ
jgi:hypothetical protein